MAYKKIFAGTEKFIAINKNTKLMEWARWCLASVVGHKTEQRLGWGRPTREGRLIKNDRKIWPVRTPAMEKKIAFSPKEKFSFEIAGRQFDELYKEVLSNKRK